MDRSSVTGLLMIRRLTAAATILVAPDGNRRITPWSAAFPWWLPDPLLRSRWPNLVGSSRSIPLPQAPPGWAMAGRNQGFCPPPHGGGYPIW